MVLLTKLSPGLTNCDVMETGDTVGTSVVEPTLVILTGQSVQHTAKAVSVLSLFPLLHDGKFHFVWKKQ